MANSELSKELLLKVFVLDFSFVDTVLQVCGELQEKVGFVVREVQNIQRAKLEPLELLHIVVIFDLR